MWASLSPPTGPHIHFPISGLYTLFENVPYRYLLAHWRLEAPPPPHHLWTVASLVRLCVLYAVLSAVCKQCAVVSVFSLLGDEEYACVRSECGERVCKAYYLTVYRIRWYR